MPTQGARLALAFIARAALAACLLPAVLAGGEARAAMDATELAALQSYSQRSGGVSPDAPTPLLAGLYVDGRELPAGIPLLVTPDGERFAVAIAALARALGLELRQDAQHWIIPTPIGDARIDRAATASVDGIDYVWSEALGEALASDIDFDGAAFALRVDTPWPGQPPAPEAVARPVGDAVQAPTASLDFWRTEALYVDDDGSSAFSTTDLGGALAGGFWRLRYEDDFEDSRRLRDWAWIHGSGGRRVLLGHQRVRTSSLLQSFDLAGAQLAWTNRPDALYGSEMQYGELVSSRALPVRNLRGIGPPGGVAELRIDGIPVRRDIVALDGRYEFRDVEIPGGSGSLVEVALYERNQFGTPVRIDDFSGQASDLLLQDGAVVHHGGIGQLGNPLDPDDTRDGTGAFYQYRHGLSPRLTLDLAAQDVDGRSQFLAGAALALGGFGTVAGQVAESDGDTAFLLQGDGRRDRWWWRMQWRDLPEGFLAEGSPETVDRYAEVGSGGARWSASLVARSGEDAIEGSYDFVRPAVAWRPAGGVYLSARPDRFGDYTVQASWRISARHEFSAWRSGRQDRFEYQSRLSDRWRITAARVQAEDDFARNSLIAHRGRASLGDFDLSLGALESEGEFGWLVDAGKELRPGLELRAQWLDDPLFAAGDGQRDARFQLLLVADFAVTPLGLARGSYRRTLDSQGSIAGALELDDGTPVGALVAVGRVPVRVGGELRGSLDANGRFFIDELPAGLHRIELDVGELPPELSLVDPERWAEVRAGSSTTVRFLAELRLGFGGRILAADGDGAAGVSLVVRGADGAVVAGTRTDGFGHYRFDGLAPGRYALEVEGVDGAIIDNPAIELQDRYLVGIDRRLGVEP